MVVTEAVSAAYSPIDLVDQTPFLEHAPITATVETIGILSDREREDRVQLRERDLPRVWTANEATASRLFDLALAHMGEIHTITSDMRLLDVRDPQTDAATCIYDPRYFRLERERATLQGRLGLLMTRLAQMDTVPEKTQHSTARSTEGIF